MGLSSRYWSRLLRLCCGCVLTVAGAWGCVAGVRTTMAQAIYKHAKYGMFLETRFEKLPPQDASEVLSACGIAHRLYPRNYYFPILASARSLEAALAAPDPAAFRRAFGNAEHWNRVSMALNPFNIEAMHVRRRILQERGDHAGAIAFWRDEVLAKQFWDPHHHEILVETCLRAGQLTQAIDAARWLRGGETLRKVRMLEQRRNALRQAEQSGTN